MMCKKCGTKVSENESFCPTCGAKIEKENNKVTKKSSPASNKNAALAVKQIELLLLAVKKRLIFLAAIMVGCFVLFTIMDNSVSLFDRIGMAFTVAVALYLPFRISFSIPTGFLGKIFIGIVILIAIMVLANGSNALAIIILLGGLIADFAYTAWRNLHQ